MKYCVKCGRQLSDDALFCDNCGYRFEEENTDDYYESKNIKMYPDGKYRWVYEVSLYKNPVILMVLYKVFGLVFLAITVLLVIMDGFGSLKIMLAVIAGVFVLVTLSYFLYALINGGKYCCVFTMDDAGVLHEQQEKTAKKSELIGTIAAITGALAKNVSTAGIGLASTRTSMYSDFKKVRSIEGLRKRNTVKVNELMNKNQVYCEDEDYDFVCEFITSHCEKAKIKK